MRLGGTGPGDQIVCVLDDATVGRPVGARRSNTETRGTDSPGCSRSRRPHGRRWRRQGVRDRDSSGSNCDRRVARRLERSQTPETAHPRLETHPTTSRRSGCSERTPVRTAVLVRRVRAVLHEPPEELRVGLELERERAPVDPQQASGDAATRPRHRAAAPFDSAPSGSRRDAGGDSQQADAAVPDAKCSIATAKDDGGLRGYANGASGSDCDLWMFHDPALGPKKPCLARLKLAIQYTVPWRSARRLAAATHERRPEASLDLDASS